MLKQRAGVVNHAQAVSDVGCPEMHWRSGLHFDGCPEVCCASLVHLKNALSWPSEGLILVQRSRIWEQ